MHDALSVRLASILFKLNQGEKIHPQQLAEEFAVDVRTIQRDLNSRLSSLPIQKYQGYYQLDPSYLGRLSSISLKSFAMMAGVQGLFPRLDHHFIRQLSQQMKQPSIQVQGQAYEPFDTVKVHLFEQIEQAIVQRHTVQFSYQKRDGIDKQYQQIQPYRLKNHDGIWYLIAVDAGMLKSFSLNRIGGLLTSSDAFDPDPRVIEEIEHEDSVWLGSKQSVLVRVTGQAIQYFKRRNLLPKQKLISESSESLILSTQIRHVDQLLPIVQYWIPYVQIVEPKQFNNMLSIVLKNYLQNSLSR